MSSLGAIPVLLLAAVVVVEAFRAVAAVRRARRLERAMHELRRPLQALSLILEGGVADSEAGLACMAQARVALDELGAVACGGQRSLRRRDGELTEVLEGLMARWRPAGVEVDGETLVGVVADPEGLGAALDNLVANALEHGARPVTVRTVRDADAACFEVRDAGSVQPRPNRVRDRSRGHGLSIVREYATTNGGTSELMSDPQRQGTMATIRIPVQRPLESPARPFNSRGPGDAA